LNVHSLLGACAILSGPIMPIDGAKKRYEYTRPMLIVIAITDAKLLRIMVCVAKRGVVVRTVETLEASIGAPIVTNDSLQRNHMLPQNTCSWSCGT
jgi:hypothetical protein